MNLSTRWIFNYYFGPKHFDGNDLGSIGRCKLQSSCGVGCSSRPTFSPSFQTTKQEKNKKEEERKKRQN